MRKKIRAIVLVLTALFVACFAAACGDKGGGSQKPPATSDYTVSITAVGSTTIKVSKTVTLRTTVVGTSQKDVTWSSLNENIATVTDRGVVTGVSAGEATIKATLNIDPNCTATIKITVEPAVAPTSIAISGAAQDLTGWVGETEQLTIAVEPAEASEAVEWTSSATDVAEVSDSGLVTFKSKGTVTVTAASKADATKTDSVTYTVRKGVFIASKSAETWDMSMQDSDTDPYIQIKADNADDSQGFRPAYFAGFTGTRFYTEVTFTAWEETEHTWDWQGFGLGTGLSDSDMRFFTFSPHSSTQTANNFNKVIVRDEPISWGALTTRSQTWGGRGLDAIKQGDAVTIGMLRDGNDYYYFLNGALFYFDYTLKYDGKATYPTVVTYDMPVKVTDFSLVTDETLLNEKLESEECSKSFWARDGVTYVNDAKFSFDEMGFAKDREVHSIGDKAMVMRDFSIEFEMSDINFGTGAQRFKGVTVNLSRYDTADSVETMGFGPSNQIAANGTSPVGRFFAWNYPEGMESSKLRGWSETAPVTLGEQEKHKVRITRTIDEATQTSTFRLFIDGVEQPFVINDGDGTGATVNYIGSYLIWVAGEYTTFKVTNFTFDSGADASTFPAAITLAGDKDELEIGDVLGLVCSGANATFASSDDSVATIAADGKVTAKGAGKVVITATVTAGEYVVKACKTITVVEPPVVTITNTETELWPTDRLQIKYELSKPSAHKFVFKSSDNAIATVSADGVVTPVSDGNVTITVQDSVNENVKAQITLAVYTTLRVQITNTQTYIETGTTLKVAHRFSFDQDSHTVSYSSSDESIATVGNDGVIHPVKEGVVTITVTCKEDSSVTATKQFNIVPPLSMEIKNTETEMWLTGKLTLDTQFSYPCDHTITYSSSDEKIATVSNDGVITAVGVGTVTVTATCEARNLTDTITLKVKDLLIDTTIDGSGEDSYVGDGYPLDYTTNAWDYTHLGDKNPTLTTKADVQLGGYRPVAAFKDIKGKVYYAEAKISITDYSGDNVWAGVSLANLTDTGYKRGLLISATQANRPMVMKNGFEDWAGTSTEGMEKDPKGTQMWGDKWLVSLSNDNIKLGLLRNNDTFYYFVNGVLILSESWSTMAHDGNNKDLTNIDTMPIIRLNDVKATVSELYATTDAEIIAAKLNIINGNDKFGRDSENVVLGDNTVTLNNINNAEIRRNIATGKEDIRLVGGKAAVIEFDLTVNKKGNNMLAGMWFREANGLTCRSYLLGNTQFGFSGWDYWGGCTSIGAAAELPASFDNAEGVTHKVKVERLEKTEGSDVVYTIQIDDARGTWTWDNFESDMIISFCAVNSNVTVSNITITYPNEA